MQTEVLGIFDKDIHARKLQDTLCQTALTFTKTYAIAYEEAWLSSLGSNSTFLQELQPGQSLVNALAANEEEVKMIKVLFRECSSVLIGRRLLRPGVSGTLLDNQYVDIGQFLSTP